jgi:hypothetical protein
MSAKPELVIGYDENSLPVEALCSARGEMIYKGQPRTKSTADVVKWFSALFRVHVERKHPSEEPEA